MGKVLKGDFMVYVCVAVVAAFIFGVIIGRISRKSVGLLVVNKTLPNKPFFEIHFMEDLDKIEKSKKVVFDRVVR